MRTRVDHSVRKLYELHNKVTMHTIRAYDQNLGSSCMEHILILLFGGVKAIFVHGIDHSASQPFSLQKILHSLLYNINLHELHVHAGLSIR